MSINSKSGRAHRAVLKIEPASLVQQQLGRQQLADVVVLEICGRSIPLGGKEVERSVAGDARLGLQRSESLGRVIAQIGWSFGAGPDDGHPAGQHVKELGQLVDLGAPEKAADAGYPWVAGGGDGGAELLGVPHHGSKLEHAEDLTVPAQALGPIENRGALQEPRGTGAQQEERSPDRCKQEGNAQVNRS